MSNPFDYVKDIQRGKKDIIRNSESPEKAEGFYNPFITNRALSFYPDSILHANEMNRRAELDKLLQFDYLINSIRSMKREYSWIKKPDEDADIEMISQYYRVNVNRAREYLKILSPHQLNDIKRRTRKGGP